MATIEDKEEKQMYCIDCKRWFERFGSEHHTMHGSHNVIPQETFEKQIITKSDLRRSKEHEKAEIPYKINLHIETDKNDKPIIPSFKSMADDIAQVYTFARIRDMPKTLWIKENRVFRPHGREILEKILSVSLASNWKESIEHSVVKYMMSNKLYKREEFDQDRMILNCKNCFVDLREHKIIEDPDSILSLSQLDTNYKPELGRSEKLEKMLFECCGDNYQLVLQIIGCALTKQVINTEQILILIGDTNNGKSTFMKIVKAVFGKSVISSVKLQDIQDDKYAAYHLEHKMLNMAGEIPEDKPLESFDVLKIITGTDDYLSVQDKNVSRHEADIYATLVFSCNELPDLPQSSASIYKRLTVIPFPNKFEKNDCFIDQFLIEDERSRILNTFIYYQDRVNENGGNLIDPQDIEDAKELWKANSDTGTLFIISQLRPTRDKETHVTVKAVTTALAKFCTARGKPVPTSYKFNIKMELAGYEQCPTRVNNENVRCWKDVTFIAPDDDQTQLTDSDNNTSNSQGNDLATKATE